MLTKADILRSLAHPALDPARYWLTAGGAMVLYGLREATRDIDIGCEPSLAAELEAAGFPVEEKPNGRRMIHLPGGIDVSENFGRGTVQLVEGIPTVSPEDVLALKLWLNRPKDQEDIARLRAHLAEK